VPIDVFIPASVGNIDKERKKIRDNYSRMQTATGVTNKVLIEFGGKPMLQHIVEAVDGAEEVGSITIAGQTRDSFPITTVKPLHYVPGGNTPFETFQEILKFYRTWETPPTHIMNISADIPLVTSDMIDKVARVVEEQPQYAFYWNLVLAEDVLKYFPEITKVPFRTREANLRFGDMLVFRNEAVDDEILLILNELIGNRKNVLSSIKFLSIRAIIRYLFGRLTFDYMRHRVKSEFNLDTALLLTEFPEACIDLDYIEDVEKFRKWLTVEPRDSSDEQALVFTSTAQFEEYLKSRNYKKGVI
jgi:hypothetical protein